MKQAIISICTLLIILQGCNPAANDVIPDETAKKIFTPAELEGIGRMIHFVDSIVSEKTGLTDINDSYHAYIDRVNADIEKGPITPLLNDSAKFDFLETIDNDAFSAIWEEEISYIHWESRCRKFLRLSFHGKYTEYLQKTGESDELYAIIYEDFNHGRDFSPSMVATLLKNHHELDFTLYRHRLWATIFLLRMPEPIKIPDDINSRVILSTDTRVYELSALPEKIKVNITNNTNDTISTGARYHIEFFDHDQCLWRKLSLPKSVTHNNKEYILIFTDIEYTLNPGASTNVEQGHFNHWNFFSKGRHRIVME